MNSTPRNPPRFLPTLTEVVQAPNFGAATAPKSPSTDDIVRTVMQSAGPLLEQRLAEMAQGLLHNLMKEQMALLQARLQAEMEILVRQLASEAVISLSKTRHT